MAARGSRPGRETRLAQEQAASLSVGLVQRRCSSLLPTRVRVGLAECPETDLALQARVKDPHTGIGRALPQLK